MASYQDIDTRLKVVEDKIDFIMNNLRMQAQIVNNSVLDAHGKPTVRVESGSLLDWYRLAKVVPPENIETTAQAIERRTANEPQPSIIEG